jgi:hypothetical protein
MDTNYASYVTMLRSLEPYTDNAISEALALHDKLKPGGRGWLKGYSNWINSRVAEILMKQHSISCIVKDKWQDSLLLFK